MKKTYIFSNPLKEALYTQGKRWTVKFIVTVALLAILSAVSFVGGMTVWGSISALGVMLSSGFFVCFFGIQTETVEVEE